MHTSLPRLSDDSLQTPSFAYAATMSDTVAIDLAELKWSLAEVQASSQCTETREQHS